MDILWCINQAGIVFEIIGAVLIVVSAFKTRRKIKDVPDTWEADLTEKLRDIISNQAFTEL
jgi:Na+/melibiose symporter-like transporter